MKQKLLYITLMILCALAWSGEAWGVEHLPMNLNSSNWSNWASGSGLTWGNAYKKYENWKKVNTQTGLKIGDSGDGFNWEDKIITIQFNGIPDKLSFRHESQNSASGIYWYVKESSDGKTWSNEIWHSESSDNTANIQLSNSTRYVQLVYSGNLAGVFSSVSISELHYFSVEPASLDFGSTNYLYDGSVQKTFKVKHCNAGSNVTLTSNDANYTVSPSKLNTTGYDKMGEETIIVTYLNTNVGSHNTGKITVKDPNNTKYTNSDQNVSLKGTTLDRYMTVDKSSLSFGTNYKGDEVATQTFTISHCNLKDGIEVSSNKPTDFTVSSSTVPTGLGTTNTATITVTYTNTTVGNNTGTITIRDKSGKIADKTISLSGTTLDRYMTVDKNSLTFGTNYKGDEVTTQTFTISHCNLADGIEVSSNNTTDFTVSSSSVTTGLGTTSTATITITYTNNTVGDNSGTITIHDKSGKIADKTISLSGKTLDRYMTVDKNSLTFGTNYKGDEVTTQTFTISHCNLADGIEISSDNTTDFTVSSPTVNTGLGTTSTATITVTYTNNTVGDNSGTITIHDNSGKTNDLTINVYGTTRNRYLRTVTESVNFGIVDEDATAPDETFDITHLNLSADITVSYSGNAAFSVTPTSITTATDNNEKTSTIKVHFDNTIPGDYSGTITVTDNSGKCSALVITVTGSSKSLTVVLDPLSPDYEDGYYKSVTLNRTLKAGYSTIALPFDTDVSELVTGRTEPYNNANDWVAQLDIVTYNAQDGYTLYFQKVDGGTITANQPYVLHLGYEVKDPTWTDLTNGISVSGVASTGDHYASTGYSGYESWVMKANYTPGFPMAGKYGIVNSEGGLMLGSGEDAKLNAFTAYITGPTSGPNGAPRLRVAYVDGDGTATFIGSMPEDDLQGEPVAIYGPDGQRRSKMQRGVNIVRYADGTTRKINY